MSDARVEGGNRALLGFYYQMLALQGIGTLGSQSFKAGDREAIQLLTTFTAASDMTLISEESGQDIVVTAGPKRLLIQAKHSSAPLGSPLDLQEFRGILESFAHSLTLSEKQGNTSICGCLILTNREGNDAIHEIKKLILECRTSLGWKPNQAYALPQDSNAYESTIRDFKKQRPAFNGTLRMLIEYWLSPHDTKGKIKRGKKAPASLTNAALRVFPGIYFITKGRHDQFAELFTKFCRSYGAFDDEIRCASSRIIGDLMHQTGGSLDLTTRDFVKYVTKYHDARALTPNGMGTYCADAWTKWIEGCDAQREWVLPRQSVALTEAMSGGKRILFLYGPGGCGKTELLAQITKARIDVVHSSDAFDGFVGVTECSRLDREWLERAVGTWAGRGSLSNQELDSPIPRLETANPNAAKLIWIALDGLDEHIPEPQVLNDWINVARERHDLRLVLTARANHPLELHRYLFPRHVMRPGETNDPDIAFVPVDDFEVEEVINVIETKLTADQCDIRRYLSLADDSGQSIAQAQSIGDAGTLAFPDLERILKHPRMLGAFIGAELNQKGTASAALVGDADAWTRIAIDFLWQFLMKYKHRCEGKDLPSHYMFNGVLQAVARETRNGSARNIEREWTSIALHEEQIPTTKARHLFEEALSGGLIEVVAGSGSTREWEWRHPFVVDYLASDTDRRHCP